MDITSPDWSTLPEELLSSIAKRITTRLDALRLRAVCKSFRSSVPLPPKPFSLHFSHLDTTSEPPEHFVIVESTVYAFEPISDISHAHQTTKPWLVKVEESSSAKVRLHDPFSISTTMSPEPLNLLDCRVREISKGYTIQFAEDDQRKKPVRWLPILDEIVAVSTGDELAVMVSINLKLVVWRGGSGNNEWVKIDFDCGDDCEIEDIIYHSKNFYVVTSNGRAITVDPKYFKVTEAVAQLPRKLGHMSLAKSSSDLFLVEKYRLGRDNGVSVNFVGIHCNSYLNIYKLDEDKGEWILLKEGLEDRALFLCRECNFFLSAKEFAGCKWNCVYLAEKFMQGSYTGWDAAIFDLKDGSTEWLRSFPGYSEIFWPPPTGFCIRL